MYLTEEEAKQEKLCPFISKGCIGSDCMMWRWMEYEYINPGRMTESERKKCKGHCRLTGKP